MLCDFAGFLSQTPPAAMRQHRQIANLKLVLSEAQPGRTDCELNWAASQLWIVAGEQSSLLTSIATTESVSLCERMKN